MPAPISVHQQFSDTQKQDIIRLFSEGKTAKEIGAIYRKPARTIGKLLVHLGLKRSVAETAALCNKSNLDTPETIEQVRQLRPTKSLQEIVAVVGGSVSALERLCKKHGISGPEDFAALQSERMKKAWTDDKRSAAAASSEARVTPELRRKLSEGSKDLWAQPEYRRKQATIQKIVWSDITLREKMADILRDYWDSPERVEAMRAVQVLVWTDEKKAEMSAIQQRIWADPLKRQKISNLMKIVWSDPGLREANAERIRKVWESDEFRERMAKAREAQPRVSGLQTTLYSILDDLGIRYFREYADRAADPECTIGPYNFDCVIPRANKPLLVIECQGDYWHSLARAVRVDKAKAMYVARYCGGSHELKYLWEHEFGCKEKVVETLKYWLGLTELEIASFSFKDIVIRKADAVDYRLLLSKYHYLANAGRGGIAHGAYLEDKLIAVCVFSPPVRQNVDTGEFTLAETVELSRLCIHPRYQKHNFASWFVSRCLKQLDKKYKFVISYCDTTFNHDGAVYKALNFKQDKVIRPDYWYVDEHGWVMHKKTLYERAVKMSMKEAAYADKFGYKKVFGTGKLRFVLERRYQSAARPLSGTPSRSR
jgi:GNAT superfamily N-acetyltransferase